MAATHSIHLATIHSMYSYNLLYIWQKLTLFTAYLCIYIHTNKHICICIYMYIYTYTYTSEELRRLTSWLICGILRLYKNVHWQRSGKMICRPHVRSRQTRLKSVGRTLRTGTVRASWPAQPMEKRHRLHRAMPMDLVPIGPCLNPVLHGASGGLGGLHTR